MRVVDFFCGAGGFSEGFRQQGFKVICGVDNWRPAQETHKFNHPECKHPGLDCFPEIKGDILAIDIERINEIIPDSEVIVGSPPCVSFSSSNKAGKADKGLGIQLIEKYLQIVAVKKHKKGSVLKYWVLENVPNSSAYIKDKYTFSELGLDDKALKGLGITKKSKDVALEATRRGIYNAANYGAPQTRKRFLFGHFPEPVKSNEESEWVTMKTVMTALGSPYKKAEETIKDPVYGFAVKASNLTDHYYDTSVEEYEWSRAKHLKEDHGFMGKMSFPEELNRPSRTIMATQSAVSRESIIFKSESKQAQGEYRMPTIREIGTFMSFPITYQFIGNNDSTKYKLVGNAVCVKLSAAVAGAMLKAEGKKLQANPNPHPVHKEPPMNLNGWKRKRKEAPQRRTEAKFRKHIPYMKIRSFRVDLDNHDSDFARERYVWKVSIHQGSGLNSWKNAAPSLIQAERLIDQAYGAEEFKKSVEKIFHGRLPDAKEFQERHCRMAPGDDPEKILETIKKVVDKHYPELKFGEANVDNSRQIIPLDKSIIPTRIAAALYATLYVAEQIKHASRKVPVLVSAV